MSGLGGSIRRPFGRVLRLQNMMRKAGVAGAWVPGSRLGPGRNEGDRRMNLLWGPDGFVIVVVKPGGRAAAVALMEAGIRRPVIMQTIQTHPNHNREVVRLELSDFLDVMAVYTQWLAQEGRLGQDE